MKFVSILLVLCLGLPVIAVGEQLTVTTGGPPSSYAKLIASQSPPLDENGNEVLFVWAVHRGLPLFSIGPSFMAISTSTSDLGAVSFLDTISPVVLQWNMIQGAWVTFQSEDTFQSSDGPKTIWKKTAYQWALSPSIGLIYSNPADGSGSFGVNVFLAGTVNDYSVGLGIQSVKREGRWSTSYILPVSALLSNVIFKKE